MKKTIIMSKISLALFLSLLSINKLEAQISNWYGELKVQGTTLPITLEIDKRSDTTIIMMGSPAQTSEMFPITKQRLEGDSILFTIKPMGVVYRGEYNKDKTKIKGSFKQGLLVTDLEFEKKKEKFEIKRPQEPKPPYPYLEKELSFQTPGVDYTFNGTLTLPNENGKFPCVVLITGSGLQNRDEEIMGHKPFKVIADYLTRQGIAVFRYDDRGWGSNNPELMDANTYDYAKDAQNAINLLRNHPNIDKTKIGVIGHSEGGIIASIITSMDKDIAFAVLLAGTGMNGYEVLKQQTKEILQKEKASKDVINYQIQALDEIYRLIKENKTDEEISKEMNSFFDKVYNSLSDKKRGDYQFSSKAARTQFISQSSGKWMRCFMTLEPKDFLEKINQPLLSIIGTKDIQVLYKYNMPAIEKAVLSSGNKNFEKYSAKNMNHLFQECKKCTIGEYSELEETFSPKVLTRIAEFIHKYSNIR